MRQAMGRAMAYGIGLHVWGPWACFTRPEMKVERASYDVMTPSAARGILEAIHWKPAIRWKIDRIHVLKPIRFQSIRRNEVASKISARNVAQAMKAGSLDELGLVVEDDRQQRATLALYDVAYHIEAHFELTDRAEADDSEGKHADMFRRRAEKGQCFHRPCLGVREFAADFAWAEAPPPSDLPNDQKNRDLGYMLYDIEHKAGERTPLFFRAQLEDGVLDIAKARKASPVA
jgi:CRISPR-associated protein Cas5d